VVAVECVQEEAEDEADDEPKKETEALENEVLEKKEVLDEDVEEEVVVECKKNSITFNPIHYHNCDHYYHYHN